MDFRGVDLNLLVSLQVLLIERHVTHAAERLGISQPAMSAALARLRALFDDQLLVRGPKGLTRTPRADQLVAELAPIMGGIDALIARSAAFVARASERTFTLIATDFVELVLLPRLMAALAREAPQLQIVVKAPDFRHLEARLASGELDLAVGYCPKAPAELRRTFAVREPFVCIARRDHPQLRDGGLTLERYVALRHVQVLPEGSAMYASAVDTALAELGVVRAIALWQPSFLAVAATVAHTDLISTLPRRVALAAREVAMHEPPVPLPTADVALYWHARCQDDAGHAWLRQRVAASLEG